MSTAVTWKSIVALMGALIAFLSFLIGMLDKRLDERLSIYYKDQEAMRSDLRRIEGRLDKLER